MIKDLLEIRKEIKERKPIFIRQDTHKRRKLSLKWRKPKGIHSKIRHHFKGRSKMPSPGFKSPLKVKNLHSSGLKMIMVSSAKDLEGIRSEMEGVIIPKNIGIKKRLVILKKAQELKITILNLNANEYIKKIEDFINSKKKIKETKTEKEKIKEKKGTEEAKTDAMKEETIEQKKEQAKKEKETKPKEVVHEKLSEDKKEVEKQVKDKILTKKA